MFVVEDVMKLMLIFFVKNGINITKESDKCLNI